MKLSSILLGFGAVAPLFGSAVADTPGRITMYFTRNPSLTEDQFHNYWRNVHGPKFAAWALQHGVTQYSQYHTRSDQRDLLKNGFPLPNELVLNYDGAAEITVKDIGTFLAAYKDKPYQSAFAAEEKYMFLHVQAGMVVHGTFGTSADLIVNGHKV